jgi:hypothetical protein
MNPIRWIDRLLFATLLVATLQLPILSDHYRQYLSGYLAALNEQINAWNRIAKEFSFTSIDAFIQHLESNPDAVVQKDATSKRTTLIDFERKREGLTLLKEGSFPEQVIYMFSPNNLSTLNEVMKNFKPGLPLTPSSIVYSVVLAIVLDAVLLLPFWGAKRFRRKKSSHYEY